MDPNFNLENELKEAKKKYREKTKGMTEEEARKAREKDKLIELLYYKKRILQNYEEYSTYGKISEPIIESPLEIKKEEMVNKDVIKKGRPKEFEEEGFKMVEGEKEKEEIKNPAPKSVKSKKSSPNSKTKKKK